jgi:hypothetical protein
MAATPVSIDSCPLCGTAEGTSSEERKRRLNLQLRSLENGSGRVKELHSQVSQMCSQCQMLMIGITSDADRLELRDRIQKELEPVSTSRATEAQRTCVPGETGSGAKCDRDQLGSRRDPEERPAAGKAETREKMLDKTLADSFPTSDPPSSIPDPEADDSMAA